MAFLEGTTKKGNIFGRSLTAGGSYIMVESKENRWGSKIHNKIISLFASIKSKIKDLVKDSNSNLKCFKA